MPNSKVSVYLRVTLPDGKRPYLKAVGTNGKPYNGTGQLKAGYGLLDGRAEYHSSGTYFLRYAIGTKRVWEAVGNDPFVALDRKAARERGLRDASRGIAPAPGSAPSPATRVTIKDAAEAYLGNVKELKAYRTHGSYSLSLELFQKSCKKHFVDEVTKQDLETFAAFYKRTGVGDRTIANRLVEIGTFLKWNGIKEVTLRHRYVEKTVAAYSEEQLKALFAAANPEDRLVWEFFLGSGAREQEVANATWQDLNFCDGTFTVKAKDDWRPKDCEERVVPLPSSLLEKLKVRRNMYPNSRLIFTAPRGGTESHFLRRLKELALKAGFNCGQCRNKKGLSCAKHAVCDQFELHKFRKSFATLHHEAGVSARTLQAWLGHSSLETTLAYLAIVDMRSDKVRTQVNHTFSAFP